MPGKSGVGWIWKLTKKEISDELEKRGVQVDPNATRDDIRDTLALLVHDEANAKREAAVDTENKDKPAVELQEESVKTQDEQKVNASSIKCPRDTFQEYDSDSDSDMAENSTRIKFCLNKDKWETFVERLEFQFLARDTTIDAKKAAILLTSIDEDAYELIKNLCAPQKLSEKKYGELTKLMADHLEPKPSELMERNNFYKASQEQGESIADFAARLKKLSLKCNFAKITESLRDQFVCGLSDKDTKIKLLETEELTFDTALKSAIAREMAQKNAQSNVRSNHQQDVLAIGHDNSHRERSSYNNKQGPRTQQSRHQGREAKDNSCWNCGGRGHTRYQCPSPGTSKQRNECASCGKTGHRRDVCKYKDATCGHCRKRGHIEDACFTKRANAKRGIKKIDKEGSDQDSDADEDAARSVRSFEDHHEDFYTLDIVENNFVNKHFVSGDRDGAPMYIDVRINDVNTRMEVDSGTYESVISNKIWREKFANAKLSDTPIDLRGYDGTIMSPIGKITKLKVTFRNKTRTLDCYVLSGSGPALIGRKWLSEFGCWPLHIEERDNIAVNKIDKLRISNDFVSKYNDLFSLTPGCYNKSKTKIYLQADAKPVAFKARHVAHALRPLIENELNRLVALKHLESVEVSEWATPIVPVFKSNGNIRICGDFKITVNPFIIMNKYPLHTIDDIFSALQGGETFTELDLRHAYMQFEVEESCRAPLTIVTHKGLFRYTKIPEGIAPAPADVQQKMDECLAGISGTITYIDNIYITGRNNEEHLRNLRAVCERLQNCNLRINTDKSKFMQDKLDVLGYVIDKDGLHKSKSKVYAMVNAPIPSNAKELASFLGLINFYARFLEKRSENLKPLYDLAKQKDYVWNDECTKAFAWVKNELISPRILAHYDPKEQIVLASDASDYGLSAILSHRYKDNTEKPIAYASCIIPKKEQKRTILDKEAMAIVFGFKRFRDFVFGKEIILRTDNKSLQLILGPRKGIPQTADNRFQRWAYYLSGFRYKIEHISSKANANCDALSRLPVKTEADIHLLKATFSNVHYFDEAIDIVDSKKLARESIKDGVINKVMAYTKSDWPKLCDLTDVLKPYHRKKLELTVEKSCLFWGLRAVIPASMRPTILRELHASHMGIVKIKMFARSYVWWPEIDHDIEFTVKNCSTCIIEAKKPPNSPLTTWPWPDRAWSRLHADFLGPFYGDMYLVVICAHSKWPEIINFKKNTKAKKLIEEFKTLFARFGLPVHLVTDGGPQFRSSEFGKFLKQNSVKHNLTPPYHPATNGAAENFVGIFKDKVSKIIKGGETVESAINKFLFDYRSIEHCTTGKSPYQMMYKRDMRTRFDVFRNNTAETVQAHQRAQIVARSGSRRLELEKDDEVFIDDYRVNAEKRSKARIIKKLSPSTFAVKDEDNIIHKRHKDQIIKVPGSNKELRRSPRFQNLNN